MFLKYIVDIILFKKWVGRIEGHPNLGMYGKNRKNLAKKSFAKLNILFMQFFVLVPNIMFAKPLSILEASHEISKVFDVLEAPPPGFFTHFQKFLDFSSSLCTKPAKIFRCVGKNFKGSYPIVSICEKSTEHLLKTHKNLENCQVGLFS